MTDKWRKTVSMMVSTNETCELEEPHGLPAPLIVSLSSFPRRYGMLPLSLGCIFSQTTPADRVILWLSPEEKAELPDTVLKYVKKGLEIKTCPDTRAHKRTVNLKGLYGDNFVVIADDDLYYRPTWLQGLVRDWTGGLNEVVAYRAKRLAIDKAGNPLPYAKWGSCEVSEDKSCDPFVVPTLGFGTLFPPGSVHPRVEDIDTCMKLSPVRSDFWMYWMMRLAGASARRTHAGFRRSNWPGAKKGSITSKRGKVGNEGQIKAMMKTFGPVWKEADETVSVQ